MPDSWTASGVVLRVQDATRIDLRLDLGWRIRYDVTVMLIGVHVPPADTDSGAAARRYVTGLLERTGGALDGSGAEVTFVCHLLDAKGSHGQVLVTTPQGEQYDIGLMLLNEDYAVPASL